MNTSENASPKAVGIPQWWTSLRQWLGRFPLSILQLGMRIGVGMVFFKSGLLKYRSFEFAVKLFEDEYKLPFLAPGRCSAHRDDQRIDLLHIPPAWTGNAPGDSASTRNDPGYSDRLPHRVARSCPLGIDSHLPTHARSGDVLGGCARFSVKAPGRVVLVRREQKEGIRTGQLTETLALLRSRRVGRRFELEGRDSQPRARRVAVDRSSDPSRLSQR